MLSEDIREATDIYYHYWLYFLFIKLLLSLKIFVENIQISCFFRPTACNNNVELPLMTNYLAIQPFLYGMYNVAGNFMALWVYLAATRRTDGKKHAYVYCIYYVNNAN